MNKPVQHYLFKVSQAVPPVTECWFLVTRGVGGRYVYLRFASRAGVQYHIATRRRMGWTGPLYILHILPRG